MASPYDNLPMADWPQRTRELCAAHPLFSEPLVRASLDAWCALADTRIGGEFLHLPQGVGALPSSVCGQLFERLVALALRSAPGAWESGGSGEKDVACRSEAALSFEIKTSGQSTGRLYGNRSYALGRGAKCRSGYLLGAHFWGEALYLLRFGWVDAEDWVGQKSSSGQMAWLRPEAYASKLLCLPGGYRLTTPLHRLGLPPAWSRAARRAGVADMGQLLVTTDASLASARARLAPLAEAWLQRADFLP